MKSFIIRRLDETLELDQPLPEIKGFKYVPKFSHKGYPDIKEITIVNKELVDKLIIASFDKKYKKILEFYLKVISDNDEDSSDGKLMLALDEVARLRTIIIRKYQKVLSKKTLEKLLKKLKILENELRIKIIDYKLIKEQTVKEVMGKGR